MHLSSINNHISCLRISEMQSNWFTVFICLNDYSYWWLSTLLIHITVVVLPFCCLTEPDVLMYFASSLSHSSAAQGLWLMTTYSSQATGLHQSFIHPFSHSFSILPNFTFSVLTFMLNPFSLAFPSHWPSPSLHLCFSHIHLSSIPGLPFILPPLFLPPKYTVIFCIFLT